LSNNPSDVTSTPEPVAEPRLFDELRLIDALARVLTAIAIGIMLNRWLGPSPSLPSMTRRTWTADLRLGLAAFVLIVPPVLLVKVGVSRLINTSPLDEAHPLIQRIRAEPGQWTVFAVVGLSAVVAAPLYEELLFRLVIQGFLQRLDAWRVRHNARRSDRTSPSTPASQRGALPDGGATENVPTGYWPMLVSAALFAAVHLGNGIDPLPLFLLGTGLGYLYRQSNRLLPCVVVHALLNGLTILQLAAEALDRGLSQVP
jgi:membrane protease YdiL (CAAX protease family)